MNDIFEKMENVAKTDLNDQEWLAHQEAMLRSHIKANPPVQKLPPTRWGVGLAVLIIAAIVTFGILSGVLREERPETTITQTPPPTITSSPTHSPTPVLSQSPTPEPTEKPKPSKTPQPTQTPPIQNSLW